MVCVGIYCYFSELSFRRLSSIGDIIYNSKWIDLPSEQRKCITMIIKRSQKATLFTGLGIVGCTLQIYGDVSNFLNLIHFSKGSIIFLAAPQNSLLLLHVIQKLHQNLNQYFDDSAPKWVFKFKIRMLVHRDSFFFKLALEMHITYTM